MALTTRTGTVVSCTRTGTTGTNRTVVMCFTPPTPCEEVTFREVKQAYYTDLLAAKMADKTAKVSYDNETADNDISGTTV